MVKALLNRLYEDVSSTSGLAGEKQLFNDARRFDNITLQDVRSFLKEKDAHTLHKITLKKFPRRKIISQAPSVIVSADLADMSLLSKYNAGYKYILVCIDVFSRYLQAALLKKKNAACVVHDIKTILESEKFKRVSRLHVDKGGEFYNKQMQTYLNSRNIRMYSVSSYEIKAAISESFRLFSEKYIST